MAHATRWLGTLVLLSVGLVGPAQAAVVEIIGGETTVEFNDALPSLGLTPSPRGDATAVSNEFTFPITGGASLGTPSLLIVRHDNSGVELTDSSSFLFLDDFVVNTGSLLLTATVSTTALSLGSGIPLFDIVGTDLGLALTAEAVAAVQEVFGATVPVGTIIGNVTGLNPTFVPVPAALPLLGSALLGLGFIARRRRRAV